MGNNGKENKIRVYDYFPYFMNRHCRFGIHVCGVTASLSIHKRICVFISHSHTKSHTRHSGTVEVNRSADNNRRKTSQTISVLD